MTRIAVTGASGFVGRELIPQLLEEGHEVRGIARRAPHPASTRMSDGTAAGFEFVSGDVRDEDAVSRTVEGCEAVIHMAASMSYEDNVAGITVDGTRRILAAAQSAGVRRVVMLSCLGADAASHSPFYAAKWQAESLVRGSGLPYVILRPSLVLGRDDGIVRALADIMRAAPVVPVPGTGRVRQQPVDVLDLCRCIREAVTSTALENQMVSVGGPMFITFRQLVDLIAGELGLIKPKALVPVRLLPVLTRFLPDGARALYSEPGVARFRHGVVASPGIVERMFGFEPSSVISRLGYYLA